MTSYANMERFTNLAKARAYLEEWGGLLLDQGDHYLVGYIDLDDGESYLGRNDEHLCRLAPSYDETDPANSRRPAQLEML